MAGTEHRAADGKRQLTKRGRRLVRIVFCLVLLVIVIAVIGSRKTPPTSSAGNSGTVAANTDTAAPPTTAVTYSNVTVMPSTQGSGIQSLQSFTIPGGANAWFLGWSYNCGSFGTGNFIVDVNGLDGTQTTDAGVNELGVSGNSVESYYDTGTFQLVVNSECNWSLKVTASEPS